MFEQMTDNFFPVTSIPLKILAPIVTMVEELKLHNSTIQAYNVPMKMGHLV